MTAPVCPRCGKRLCVDNLDLCLICLDRAVLERQKTLDQEDLGKWSK